MALLDMIGFSFCLYVIMLSMLTDPHGTLHLVLAPVRFVRALGLRVYWAIVAVIFIAQFLLESSCYLYLAATGGSLPEIAPANPVPVLVSDDRGWSRVMRPPVVEIRLLEAFWASTLFRELVAEIKQAASPSSSTPTVPPLLSEPEPAQVPLPLSPETREALRRAA
ncbi:hypothetical protein BG000_004865 [Podila horticola]|nr:hypothetical protein BG000_004865 [Podila horticola]